MFEKDDYRLARFVNKKKEVNERFAIDLINEVPPKEEKDRVVWCDGGESMFYFIDTRVSVLFLANCK